MYVGAAGGARGGGGGAAGGGGRACGEGAGGQGISTLNTHAQTHAEIG